MSEDAPEYEINLPWPKYVVDQLGRDPQIGDWYSICCELDLYQIENAEDLESISTYKDEEEWDQILYVFKTREEGVAALAMAAPSVSAQSDS